MVARNKNSVLIVEDEPGIAQLLSERLSKLGLEVSLAASAEEAERHLADNSPSLILLDYSLPGKSGMDFIKTLKAGRGTPPPFIVTTGRGDESLAVALMKLGAWDYLVKDGDFLDKVGPASQKAISDAGLRAELERKETVLAEVIKGSKDPIFALDKQLRYIAFNPAYAEAMRAVYGAEVEPGGTLPEAVAEPVRSALIANVLRALAGEAFSVEVQLGGEPRGRRWFELKYAPLRAQSGGVIGVSVIGRDVMARKMMEAQLLEKNELFSRILGSAGGTFFSVNPDGVYIFFNEAHAALMKQWYGRDIELGRRVLDYVPDEAAADRFKTRLARGLAGEEYVEELESRRTAAGPVHYFEVVTAPVRGDGGGVVAVSVAARDVTERRRLEVMLKASEERFRELFEKAPLGYQSLDGEGRLLEVNQAWLDTLGYSKEEVIGKWFGDFLAPEFVDVFRQRFPMFKAAGKVHSEFEMLRKDGGRRFVAFDGRIAFNQTGEFQRTHCILKDITEAKAAEERLKNSEAKFRTVFEAGNDAMFLHPLGSGDEAGNFVEVNSVACQRLGYTREELLRMGPADLDADGMDARRHAALQKLAEQGQAVFEMRHRAKDGRSIEVEISARRFDYEGVPYVFSVARDTTERKKAEAERQLLSESIAASLNEVYIFDAKTLKFRFLNRGALENTGYTQEEAAGMTPLELKPDLTADEFVKYTGPLLSGEKKVQVFETRHRRKDGSLYPVEVHLQYEPANAVFLAVINDITYKKRMESDLMRSQKIESLGLLAGGIAHDFNNMLTGITANLSLLAARNPGAADLVADSLAAAKAAQSLTAQLLSFSKGGKPVKKEFSPGRALREIFSLATRGSSVNQRLDIPEGLWSVDGDENQIKQALNNLLLNALQAMPSGGTLTLKAENAQAGQDSDLPVRPGSYLRVTVSDTGIGIPEDYLSRIFEPYFTTKTKGHGLGLPMTWSVIKNHGGYIDADSVPGEGTRFVIYLPATGRCCLEETDAAKQAPKGSGRVLVLEDEEIVARAAERMLKELGYSGEFTADGADTLRRYSEEKAAGRPFDAVILDLTIPGGMGGREAGKELRRLHPEAVLIVSSGYSEESVMSDFKAHGFDAVLPKPYRYEELAETLAGLLRKRK